MSHDPTARAWYQWIDGVKTNWPYDEAPHPDNIFNVNFINQFIAWANYIRAFEGAEKMDFLEPGDKVQHKGFWNNLEASIYTSSGWLNNIDYDFTTSGAKISGWSTSHILSYALSYFPLTNNSNIATGDNIQDSDETTGILYRLWRFRKRMDMHKVKTDIPWTTSTARYGGWDHLYSDPPWSDYLGHTENGELDDSNTFHAYYSGISGLYEDGHRWFEYYTFLDIDIPEQDYPCGVVTGYEFLKVPASYIEWPWTDEITALGTLKIFDVLDEPIDTTHNVPLPTAVSNAEPAWPGTGVAPGFSHIEVKIVTLRVVLDELPSEYEPPEEY